MKRKPGPEQGPGLFDLPLDAAAASKPRPASRASSGANGEPPASPVAPEPDALFGPEGAPPDAPAKITRLDETTAPETPVAAPLVPLLRAGLIDLVVTLAVALSMAVGLRAMGIELAWRHAPAAALFLLAFSFLYLVTPLAFWGRTPGMAWAGLVARDTDGGPLAFRQSAVRWLGALATTLALGLPLLLVLLGSSLSDRLSGSRTYLRR